MSNTLSVSEVALAIGKTEQFVRVGLQQNRFRWGEAVRMPGGRWSYVIYRRAFEQSTGIVLKGEEHDREENIPEEEH